MTCSFNYQENSYGELDISMLSDFSTLTDLRDLESTLDRVLLISISSEMGFNLRSGVRERRLDDDDFIGGTISLLRLERDRVDGDGE